MGDKKDIEGGDPGIAHRRSMKLPTLPKALTLDEKKYLLAVERGDMANVRKILQKAIHLKDQGIDVNCVDALGRGALTLAIDGENLEMLELLVVMGVQTKDALLQAINAEFVEAVELLLEHEELIHKDPGLHSWQKMELDTATFSPDITPLMLAAHKNNYEIIKILLDRGATLPDPHDVRCGCDTCVRLSTEDSLRYSMARLNAYKALSSPSLIALSATDPMLAAFQLSWELRTLAFAEQETKNEYLELRRRVQKFAVDLLDQTRGSHELAIILNHDPEAPPFEDGDHMKLARLELAIDFKQKKFVAHPNIQQLLAAIWYEGVPGFRRKSAFEKIMIIVRVAVMFPFYCTMYMIAPSCATGRLVRKPFMKFLIHASSYLFFLFILILVSLRAEVEVIQLFGTENMVKQLQMELKKQRGNGPSYLEMVVAIYVLGFIWEETQEIYVQGIRSYLRNMWNFIDFTRNLLYVTVAFLRLAAYIQQAAEIAKNPQTRFIPREHWDAFDPQLIAEGLFAAANIFSALKLLHLFSINPHLGPLQISLGRMVIDIVKFFFIYSLVLFAFACGLNQLLWYFANLEKSKCYVLPGGLPDWDNAGDSCMKWRSFGNVFEASQSLFWASFGMVGLENFELAGIKSYTRFWGLLMFGSYSVINVIVLLNLLIAMMSNSYAMIEQHSDVEWKFARTRLWMSYFEESATLPPPFNIVPTPKIIMKLLGMRKKEQVATFKEQEQKEKDDVRYTAVMRALVWRYVSAMHKKMVDEPVTEDDINELKGDVSALRYELLEVFDKNGMDVSFTDRKEKAVLAKRMKVWERRLMKDFQVAPVSTVEEDGRPVHEDSLSRFRRIAKMAAAAAKGSKWDQALAATGISSQIGRCRTRQSFKNQQNLQRAIDEARRLVLRAPMPESRSTTPIHMPESHGESILELIKDISSELEDNRCLSASMPRTPSNVAAGSSGLPIIKLVSPGGNRTNAVLANLRPVSLLHPVDSLSRPQSPAIPRPASPCGSEKLQPEPTPLKSNRVQGSSPQKVVKKKAPAPLPGDNNVTESKPQGEKPDTIAVARPVAPEIKPTTDDALPPPPVYSKNRPPTDMSPCPSNRRPVKMPRSRSPSASNVLESPPTDMSPCPSNRRPVKMPRSRSPSASNVLESLNANSTSSLLVSSLSTEQLIPQPVDPTTGQSIQDVRTIKRQPKTGWL